MKIVYLLLSAIATLLMVAASGVLGQRSVECQIAWSGASSNNDIWDCLGNSERLRSEWRFFVFPGFAAVIFLFTLIGLPIIYLCRCCSCCRNCVQPSQEIDRAKARCWLWMWIFVAILWACAVCVLIIYGAALTEKSAYSILDDITSDTIPYFTNTKETVSTLMTDYSQNPPASSMVDLSTFDTVIDNMTSLLDTIRTDYFKYFKIASIVGICVGTIGVVLMLCLGIFAFLRCGGCVPVLMSCSYYFFALIFSLLAIVFALLMYVAHAGCGEVDLQYERAPGIFQWYVVPLCEKNFDFANLRAEVQTQEASASQDACGKMLEYCDNTDVYPGTNQNHIFMCGNGISAATDCSSLDDVVSVLDNTYGKTILTNTLCVNTTGQEYFEVCTVARCAERCVDYTAPDLPARTRSQEIVASSQYAANASVALTYLKPLLQCDFIIDRVATSVQSPVYTNGNADVTDSHGNCSNLKTATIMLAVGFFVGSLMFILGIYVMIRGSWIWSEKSDLSEKST